MNLGMLLSTLALSTVAPSVREKFNRKTIILGCYVIMTGRNEGIFEFEDRMKLLANAVFGKAGEAIGHRWASLKPLLRIPQVEADLFRAEFHLCLNVFSSRISPLITLSPELSEKSWINPSSLVNAMYASFFNTQGALGVLTETLLSSSNSPDLHMIAATFRTPVEQFIDEQAQKRLLDNSVLSLSYRINQALETNQPPTTAHQRRQLEAVYNALCYEEGFGRKLMQTVLERGFESIQQLVDELRSGTRTWCSITSIEQALVILENSALLQEKSPREKLLEGVKTKADRGEPIYFSFTEDALNNFEALGGNLALVLERIEEATSYSGQHLKKCNSGNFAGFKYRVKDEMPSSGNSKYQFYSKFALPLEDATSNRLVYLFHSLENHRQPTNKTRAQAKAAKKAAEAIKQEQKKLNRQKG